MENDMVANTTAVAPEEEGFKKSNSSSGYMSEEIAAQIQSHKDSEVFMNMDWDLHFEEEEERPGPRCTALEGPKVHAVFRWEGEGENVFLSGSYDNWTSTAPLVRSGSGFFTIVDLPQGTHQYRFNVDGNWACLPNEPKVESIHGYQCNVVTVRHSDCDVFEALALDSVGTPGGTPSFESTRWTQEIPARGTGYAFLRSGPPLLPPHLTDTILNKETPSHCDPTILVEPTHVVLNHLYTLSIKDGVMVLSTTYRYRKKYITTLLYKPI